MPRKRDLTGQTFGLLRVLAFAGIRSGSAYWECRCSCGRVVEVKTTRLLRRLTVDCGHLGYRHDAARHVKARKKVAKAKRAAIARQGAAARWSKIEG